MKRVIVSVCAVVFTLIPGVVRADAPLADAPAAAVKPVVIEEFTGYAGIPWGTRWEEVKKRLPKAVDIPDGKNLGATPLGLPFVHRLELEQQQFPGLKEPVTVELRFWKKKLWGVIVYFGNNKDEDVTALLLKRLGPQDGTDATYPSWKTDKTQTSADMRVRWFGATDTPLSLQAQAWFALLLTGQFTGASQAEMDEVENRTPAPAPPAAPAAK